MKFWILVKPEALLFCCDQLAEYMNSQHFVVCERLPFSNWDQLSLCLYGDSNKISHNQLKLQNIGRKQILGSRANDAELWIMETNTFSSQSEGFAQLNEYKRDFRKKMWHQGLNIYFEIGDQKTIYHFSYFHVPDPEIDIIENEYSQIRRYIS